MSAAHENLNNVYLWVEFRKDCRIFLNEFVSTTLLTVATRSLVGRGLSCFAPEIIVGGDNYSSFQFFGQLIVGLLNLGGVKACELEAAKSDLHSFARKQRQDKQS